MKLKVTVNKVRILCIILTFFIVMGRAMPPSWGTSPLEYDFDYNPELNPRVVLTLDVSESMESHNRINKLGEALTNWITVYIPDGMELGMVQFSSSASILSDMVLVNNETRQQLLQLIPKRVKGETCIACGLMLAMQLLKPNIIGDLIILITDVENSEPGQDVKDILEQVKLSRIEVVTIALGNNAKLDDIEQLAEVTGGVVYNIQDDEGAEHLYRALLGALNINPLLTTTTESQLEMNITDISRNAEISTHQTGDEPETVHMDETTSQHITTIGVTCSTKTEDMETNMLNDEIKFSIWGIGGITMGITIAVILLFIVYKWLQNSHRIPSTHQGCYEVAQTNEKQAISM